MLKLEDKLIIKCTNLEFSNKIILQIKNILKNKLNWDYILNRLCYHGVVSLFYDNIKRIKCNKFVPLTHRNTFSLIITFYKKRSELNLRKTFYLIGILKAHKIPVIPLKGPILGLQIYKKVFIRKVSADIDLLVKQKDMIKTCNILLENGFYLLSRHMDPFLSFNYKERKFSKHEERIKYLLEKSRDGVLDFASKRKDIPFLVEVHWLLARKWFAFDHDGIWKRVIKINIRKRSIGSLSPTDTFLDLLLRLRRRWGEHNLNYAIDLINFANTHNINYKYLIYCLKKMNLLSTFESYQHLREEIVFIQNNIESNKIKHLNHFFYSDSRKIGFYLGLLLQNPKDFLYELIVSEGFIRLAEHFKKYYLALKKLKQSLHKLLLY